MNASLWMPAVYVYVACCWFTLLLFVSHLWRVFSKCSFRRHSAYFHSALRTLRFIPQQKSALYFLQITPWQLSAFCNLHSAKCPFPAVNYILHENSQQLHYMHIFAIFRDNSRQVNARFHTLSWNSFYISFDIEFDRWHIFLIYYAYCTHY